MAENEVVVDESAVKTIENSTDSVANAGVDNVSMTKRHLRNIL